MKIDALEVPRQPKTTFNVGRVGGGTSVNAIPFEAWMEVDMQLRRPPPRSARSRYALSRPPSCQSVTEENARWNNRGPVTRLGGTGRAFRLPPARRQRESAIVQTAMAVSRALQIDEVLREGSTDSNVPMNLNIPAITISGGGAGTGAHALNEAFDSTDSWRGTQRALLLAVALAR